MELFCSISQPLQYLYFGVDYPWLWGCPLHRRTFGSIPGLHHPTLTRCQRLPLPPLPVVMTKRVSRHCPTSWVGGWLRIAVPACTLLIIATNSMSLPSPVLTDFHDVFRTSPWCGALSSPISQLSRRHPPFLFLSMWSKKRGRQLNTL